jgi:hypothetical protein
VSEQDNMRGRFCGGAGFMDSGFCSGNTFSSSRGRAKPDGRADPLNSPAETGAAAGRLLHAWRAGPAESCLDQGDASQERLSGYYPFQGGTEQ